MDVTIGDMSLVATGRRYGVVYLVYNTIFNLLTADDQVRCFENAARHLGDSGCFVVETAVPTAWISSERSEYVRTGQVGMNEVTFEVARYDSASQLFTKKYHRVRLLAVILSNNQLITNAIFLPCLVSL